MWQQLIPIGQAFSPLFAQESTGLGANYLNLFPASLQLKHLGCSSGPDTQHFHQPIRDRLSLPVLQHHTPQEAGTSQRKPPGCTPANGAVTQPVRTPEVSLNGNHFLRELCFSLSLLGFDKPSDMNILDKEHTVPGLLPLILTALQPICNAFSWSTAHTNILCLSFAAEVRGDFMVEASPWMPDLSIASSALRSAFPLVCL